MSKKRFTLDLTQSELEYWRRLAASAGYTIGRGPYAKDGSIQQLFEAAPKGDVVINIRRQLEITSGD